MAIVSIVISIILLMILVYFLYLRFFSLPKKYRSRKDTTSAWKAVYRDWEMPLALDIVKIFCADFLFFVNRDYRRILPDDKPVEIYLSLYPNKSLPDNLEFESFFDSVREKYSVDLYSEFQDDMTLKELIDLIIQKRRKK